MKNRYFKKVLSILLTGALVFGMIGVPESPVSLVAEVDANSLIPNGGQYYIRNVQTGRFLAAEITATSAAVVQQDFNANPRQRWQFDRVSGDNYRLTPMSATGSRLVFVQDPISNGVRARIEPQNQHTTRQQWNIPLIANGNHHVTRISLVGFSHRSLRPINNNQNNSPIEAWDDNQWHNYWQLIPVASATHPAQLQVRKNVDVRIDSSYAAIYFQPSFSAMFGNGVSLPFSSRFSIDVRRASTEESNQLNGASCPRTNNNQICTANCGNVCLGVHHKCSVRLLHQIAPTSNYTLRIVGHTICAIIDNVHRGHYGLAGPNRVTGALPRETLVSSVTPPGMIPGVNPPTPFPEIPLQKLIQHELSHNFRAPDHYDNVPCIMNGTDPYTPNIMPSGVW
jgi:hypothetical protein